MTDNKKPILAFLFSLVIMGLGQCYATKYRRGIYALLGSMAMLMTLAMLGILKSYNGFYIYILLIVVLKLVIAVDAFVVTKQIVKTSTPIVNKGNASRNLLFLLDGIALYATISFLQRHILGYQAYKTPTPSMEPTVLANDYIMTSKFNANQMQIGDLITFSNQNRVYVYRLMGLPGQTITIDSNTVYFNDGNESQYYESDVDGEYDILYRKYRVELPNKKRYLIQKQVYPPTQAHHSKIEYRDSIIPDGYVLVLGDNRDNALDSRYIGLVHLKDIKNKVNYVWWSKDAKRRGIKL